MGAVYDKYYKQVKNALSRREWDGTFDRFYADTWNGEYYCYDKAWARFIQEMMHSDDITGCYNGFFKDENAAKECVEGWEEDEELIQAMKKIGFSSLLFHELKNVSPEVVDKCIRCVMLTEVSDYLYSIRRGDTEF